MMLSSNTGSNFNFMVGIFCFAGGKSVDVDDTGCLDFQFNRTIQAEVEVEAILNTRVNTRRIISHRRKLTS